MIIIITIIIFMNRRGFNNVRQTSAVIPAHNDFVVLLAAIPTIDDYGCPDLRKRILDVRRNTSQGVQTSFSTGSLDNPVR